MKTWHVMMICPFLPIAAGTLAGDVPKAEPRNRTLLASKTHVGPTIDGRLDDRCWQDAPKATGFTIYSNATELHREPTVGRICFDEEHLYVFFECAVGNRAKSVKAEGSLTARSTDRAGTKVGLSDPAVPNGRAVAQRIKGTPGITGLSPPRVHIDGAVWHLDVGLSHPGAGEGPKGRAVRPLKRYMSWVQNVVRQFGLYPSWALEC